VILLVDNTDEAGLVHVLLYAVTHADTHSLACAIHGFEEYLRPLLEDVFRVISGHGYVAE
jgi:hypothetical protein